jgi:hypothetical protein
MVGLPFDSMSIKPRLRLNAVGSSRSEIPALRNASTSIGAHRVTFALTVKLVTDSNNDGENLNINHNRARSSEHKRFPNHKCNGLTPSDREWLLTEGNGILRVLR